MAEKIMTDSEKNTELASRRTGMSFQRTRMSADRTLMSVIRTALSLISFGFTIAQVFQKLKESAIFRGNVSDPRHFGTELVALGIFMLVFGIIYHIRYMLGLREVRKKMAADGLIHAETRFPTSLTLITAVILLIIGVLAIISIMD